MSDLDGVPIAFPSASSAPEAVEPTSWEPPYWETAGEEVLFTTVLLGTGALLRHAI